MQDREILIEEYRSLRSEIMKRQDARLLLVGFSVTGIAALSGLLLKDSISILSPADYLFLSIGILLIVIIALLLTVQQTHQIDILFKNLKTSELLASYLGKFTDDLSNKEIDARRYLSVYYLIITFIALIISFPIYYNYYNIFTPFILFLISITLPIILFNRGIHGTDFYIEYLIDSLWNDEDKNIRCRAARALGKIKDIKAVNALIKSLNDPKENVRIASRNSLIFIGNIAVIPLIKALNKDYENSKAFYIVMNQSKFKSHAITILGEIGDERAVDVLIDAIEYDNENAIKALGKIKNKKATEPLLKALKSNNWVTKRNSAYALGRIKDPKAIDPLIDALNDRSKEVHCATMESLALIGEKELKVLEILLDELKNQDLYIQMSAVESLRILGNEKAINPLEKLLETEKYSSRYVAIKRAIDHLKQIKRDKEVENMIKSSRNNSK